MKKILVIEDEEALLENISLMLELRNFQVVTANSGRQGIVSAFNELPDLIICDINMPEMNGFQVLETLRANPSTQIIPFIFLTARTSKEDMRYGMNLGADDFLSKPFTESDLYAAITSRLGKQQVINDNFDERVDKIQNNFILNIPLELNTPLGVILGYSELLSNIPQKFDVDLIHRYGSSIHESAETLQKIFEKYIYYINLFDFNFDDNHLPNLYAQNADAIIQKVVDYKSIQYKHIVNVTFSPTGYGINILAEHFERIVSEILDNAFNFSTPGTTVEITSKKINANYLNLNISNIGAQFSSEQYFRTNHSAYFNANSFENKKLGFGLAIVKKILSLYDGDLHIENHNGMAIVSLQLPVIND